MGHELKFVSPSNPHSGCFFLTHDQLRHWVGHESWQDGDDSWVSPWKVLLRLGFQRFFNFTSRVSIAAAGLNFSIGVKVFFVSFVCLDRLLHPLCRNLGKLLLLMMR